jgi:hypothetical protein
LEPAQLRNERASGIRILGGVIRARARELVDQRQRLAVIGRRILCERAESSQDSSNSILLDRDLECAGRTLALR